MRAWLVAAALLPLVAQAQTPASLKDIAVFPERDAPASVLAANESKIAAEVAGQIVELTDAVGGVVPKGAVLARIDARDYELALARARAALDASRARTLQAETQLTRARDLHAKNFISADGLIQRETEAAVQRADVKLNEAQLASAERNLAKCVIRAPFAAVVRARRRQSWRCPHSEFGECIATRARRPHRLARTPASHSTGLPAAARGQARGLSGRRPALRRA